jgi:NTE family protein
MSGKHLGLALGSGSARGLAHIGVLKVCERERIPVDSIVGTSMGAIIGGAYASGMSAHEMEEVACSVDIRRLISLADIARPSTALVNGRRVERLIRDLVGDKTFAETKVPFACVAVDVVGQQEVVLRDGDLASAIRASISTPILFAPTERDGRLLVDGGVMNPVPVDVVRDMGADVVVAVTAHGLPRSDFGVFANTVSEVEIGEIRGKGLPKVIYSRAVSVVKDRLRQPTVFDVAATSINLMQRELSEPRLKLADLVIAPLINGTSAYSFHEATKIIAVGEQAAERAVDELRRLTQRNERT